MAEHGYEQVVMCHDRVTGLRAVIAIHDTTLGPALGGCRMWPYESEDQAIIDAMRLARSMTYKSAVAGLNLGGGKGVIIGDPRRDKTEGLLRAFGRFVQSLQGRYYTAEDVGTGADDMEIIRQETQFVTGTLGTRGSGDPSPATAFGVLRGIEASAQEAWGSPDLKGRVVAIQGLGHVGYNLARLLHEKGARLVVCDILPERAQRADTELGARVVAPEDIYAQDCDIFSPCALGAVINRRTVPQLRCRIVAGAANNQLDTEADGESVEDRGILYAPDYVLNAGGVINAVDELYGYDRERVYRQIDKIRDNLTAVFALAKAQHIPTFRAADAVAQRRIQEIGRIHQTYLPRPVPGGR
jgi:leucine dehydrogenase